MAYAIGDRVRLVSPGLRGLAGGVRPRVRATSAGRGVRDHRVISGAAYVMAASPSSSEASCSAPAGAARAWSTLAKTSMPMERRDSVHSSVCSMSTAPMRRMMEDPDHVRPAADFPIESLLGIRAPDLAPDLPGEAQEREQVLPRLLEVRRCLGELGFEGLDHAVELGVDLGRVGLVEDGAHQGGHIGRRLW